MTLNKKIKLFKENVRDMLFFPRFPKTPEEEKTRIEKIIDMAIGGSYELRAMWISLRDKVEIYFTRDVLGARAQAIGMSLAVKEGRLQGVQPSHLSILINPDFSNEEIATVFLHEMRHVLQYTAGAVLAARQCSVPEAAWHKKVLEADAESFNILHLFRRHLDGDSKLYDIHKNYSPVMMEAMEKAYKEDPHSLFDGRLRRAAFDAWFENKEKCLEYETDAAAFYQILLGDAWLKIQENNIILPPLTVQDLEVLGAIGFGGDKNYLTLPGFRPLDDPYYRLNFASDEMKKLWAEECAKNRKQSKNSLPKPR